MLKSEEIKKVEDFVYVKPRSIQEIAEHLDVSWRTADRYVEEIKSNFGTLDVRTFREGTRGALKIVFWASVEKVSSSLFQEQLEKEIYSAKRKEDFSAFDVFQHIPDKNKRAIIEKAIEEDTTNLKELAEILKGAKKQVLIFSGNLSFINLKNKTIDIYKILEDLVRNEVNIKILSRVDLTGKENIEKLLSLNFKYGKELIEVRHREHPIRANIVDGKILRMKEVKEPTGKINELDKKTFIFYTIKDKDWAEWMSRIFWKLFSSSVSSKKRLEELGKIK
jgi:hypothetical protein